jgi:Ca2+-transporting ATPase
MLVRIIIQTVVDTCTVLGAYLIGLRYFGHIPRMAETMAFATLSLSELLRAFSARSELRLVFRLGLFSNPAMFYAVATSIVLLLVVIYIPILQPLFNTVTLTWVQWRIIGPLILVPLIAAELSKLLVARKAAWTRKKGA